MPPVAAPPPSGLPPGLRPIQLAAPPPALTVEMEMKEVVEDKPEHNSAPAVFKTDDGQEVQSEIKPLLDI